MTTKPRVLIVDDERNLRESLAELVESEGYAATQAADGAEAVRLLRAAHDATADDDAEADFAVIFLDIRMPRMDGFGALDAIYAERLTDAPVIVISAFGASSDTIEAMRRGAYDYITKPLDLDEILGTLARAAAQHRLTREAKRHAADSAPDSSDDANDASTASDSTRPLIGTSRAMRDLFKQIGRVAATDATVLISGESGTGKELVAQAIHHHSARGERPFVAVNCGAIPENLVESELFGHERGAFTGADKRRAGRFQLADTGTLFLDEVGELSLAAQVKLLRVLQERRVEPVGASEGLRIDVRIIAATNRDLKIEVAERRFREDLFYRLSVVELHLPPLRARLADVPQLAEHFIERAALRHKLPTKTLSDDALRLLLAHDYPGNVRELENIIERAMVTSATGGVILAENLFDAAPRTATRDETHAALFDLPFHEAVAALERELIRRALAAADGNRTDAARRLGINRRLLYSKLDEHGIQ